MIQRKRKKRKVRKSRFDFSIFGSINQRLILFLTILISLIGLFFVFEASVAESFSAFGHQYHFISLQAKWFVVGLFAMIFSSLLPYKFWQKTAPIWYFLGLVLLVLVFIPGLGVSLNGASRWINFGLVRLQPIEFFKFSLIIYFASWMSKTQKLSSFVFLTGVPTILILLQPDLGSLLIVLWVAFGMYFLAGGHLKKLSLVSFIGVLLLIIVILLSPYRMKRLKTFLNPESDPLGASFHIRQITLALGNGGWFGQGLGNSRAKYAYIPEASSDSIFAIVAEEIGVVGAVIIIFLYILLFYFIYKSLKKVPVKSFAYLLGYGILLWISGQAILNLAAIVALVPLTGLPLPLFSYGGSSLVMILFSIGILLRLEKEGKKKSK